MKIPDHFCYKRVVHFLSNVFVFNIISITEHTDKDEVFMFCKFSFYGLYDKCIHCNLLARRVISCVCLLFVITGTFIRIEISQVLYLTCF